MAATDFDKKLTFFSSAGNNCQLVDVIVGWVEVCRTMTVKTGKIKSSNSKYKYTYKFIMLNFSFTVDSIY